MINRVIGAIFSISLMFCLASAWAGPGQTIRNGGGDGELAFSQVWRNLKYKFEACTHPSDPCGLGAKTRELLGRLIKFKGDCFRVVTMESLGSSALSRGGACGEPLTVNSDLLYRAERPIGESEMYALALEVLHQRTCEGVMQGEDFRRISEAAGSIRYFQAHELKSGLYMVKSLKTGEGDQLFVTVNALKVDLNGLLRSKHPKVPDNVDYLSIESYVKEGRLDVRGEIAMPGGKRSPFFISLDPSLDLTTAFVYLL